ncbi:MAG: hypothetical protein ABII01_07005 [Candidatus Woesearchaeota archaeon]
MTEHENKMTKEYIIYWKNGFDLFDPDDYGATVYCEIKRDGRVIGERRQSHWHQYFEDDAKFDKLAEIVARDFPIGEGDSVATIELRKGAMESPNDKRYNPDYGYHAYSNAGLEKFRTLLMNQ